MLEFANLAGTTQDKPTTALENRILNLFEEFARENISIRYVTMNDASRPLREGWMERTFRNYEQFEFAEADTRFLSAVGDDFDVLIVGGNDMARISALMRLNRPALANRVKICLMSRSNSHKRARILGSGYDDAIDIARVSPAEAVARILALIRRRQIKAEQGQQERDRQLRLAEVFALDDVPPRQRQAMDMLFRHCGKVVTYGAMVDEIGGYRSDITPANLKVIVCKLRKCLIGPARIVSVTRTGYKLETGMADLPATSAG